MTSPTAEIQAEAQPEAAVTAAYWVQADAITAGPEAEHYEPEAEI